MLSSKLQVFLLDKFQFMKLTFEGISFLVHDFLVILYLHHVRFDPFMIGFGLI